MKEVGEKKKAAGGRGGIRGSKALCCLVTAKTPAYVLMLPCGHREGVGWVLVLKGRTSMVSQLSLHLRLSKPALGEQVWPAGQHQPPALSTVAGSAEVQRMIAFPQLKLRK